MGIYTGHVEPHGEPAHRDVAGLTVTKVSVGPMDNNAYLLRCHETGDRLLVDAANDANRILALLDSGGTALTAVVTTHRHADHWQALEAIVRQTDAPVLAGNDDADHLPLPVDRRLMHGDRIAIGGSELEVIALRGHTPGSIALAYREPNGSAHVFTGDSLFPGGPGRTTTPADFASLMDDLAARVFDRFDDDTWIYPGHGDDTTLGVQRPYLSEWRDRGW